MLSQIYYGCMQSQLSFPYKLSNTVCVFLFTELFIYQLGLLCFVLNFVHMHPFLKMTPIILHSFTDISILSFHLYFICNSTNEGVIVSHFTVYFCVEPIVLQPLSKSSQNTDIFLSLRLVLTSLFWMFSKPVTVNIVKHCY